MYHRSWLGLAVILVAVLVTAGCSGLKEELATAKKKVDQLTAETKQLKQRVGQLEDKEKEAKDELRKLEDDCSKLRAEAKGLTRKNEGLSNETKKLRETGEQLKKQVLDLKNENKDLTRKVEELKTKNAAQEARPLADPAPRRPEETGRTVETGKEQAAATPCDALMEFMRKSANVIRQLRGEERLRGLQQLEKDYSAKIKDAPKKATVAAKTWVKALSAGWNKTTGDSIFKILVHKNKALKACGKTPKEAGF
jgi:chromosome segregation ATPase